MNSLKDHNYAILKTSLYFTKASIVNFSILTLNRHEENPAT